MNDNFKKYLVDTSSNLIFWDSAWFGVFLLVRLSMIQIEESLALGTFLAILLARPYGIFLDLFRRRLG